MVLEKSLIVYREFKMDSDDQESVLSEKSTTNKSLIYDDHDCLSCDTIISNFNHCNFNDKNYERIASSPVSESNEENYLTEDTVEEISEQTFNVQDWGKTVESMSKPVCQNNKEQKKCDKSTNTEKYKGKKMFRYQKKGHYKYKPYGYQHRQHFNRQCNNYRNNYYQKPFYNNYHQPSYFNPLNRFDNSAYCNRYYKMNYQENQYLTDMLFKGIYHLSKFLECLSHIYF